MSKYRPSQRKLGIYVCVTKITKLAVTSSNQTWHNLRQNLHFHSSLWIPLVPALAMRPQNQILKILKLPRKSPPFFFWKIILSLFQFDYYRSPIWKEVTNTEFQLFFAWKIIGVSEIFFLKQKFMTNFFN